MFLYPYKIFTVSSNKRLLKPSEPNRTIGIYDATLMSYTDAKAYCISSGERKLDVSVLLGDVIDGIKLICLDLDDCIDEKTGDLDTETLEFLREFSPNEYELSTSGTGLHIYILTRLNLSTFIVKEMEGCKSFECYTNKRHIVTTTFDFLNTNLIVGKHDTFLLDLYNKANKIKDKIDEYNNQFQEDVKKVFQGEVIKTTSEFNGKIYGRTPVTDMYTLRGLGYKDPQIIAVIDEDPSSVDQSAHDAKLIRKLMYYTLSFETAWELAKKTNYYKAKDKKHKEKFDKPAYIERTRKFIIETGA